MSLEFILLGLLRDPASGYELRQEFDRGPRHFWSARLSQIYPTLQRMEDRGWLTSTTKRSDKGPDRRVYRRTRAGTTALHAWLRAQPDLGVDRLPYIGQLVFLGELHDRERTRAFLTELRDEFVAQRDVLRHSADAWHQDNEGTPGTWDDDALHELFCIEIGLGALGGKIAACERALGHLTAPEHAKRKERRNG